MAKGSVQAPAGGSGPKRRAAGKGASQPAGKTPIPLAEAKRLALSHFQAGRLGLAARICGQLIEARPKDADLHNLMGVILNAQGSKDVAVKALKNAIRLDDRNSRFYSNLGEIQRQRGEIDAAQAALRKAVELDPDSAQALCNLGIVHFDRREFEEAAACYEQALAKNSSYPEAENNLGNALRALDRPEEAVEHYENALLLRENYPEAYNNLAAVLRDTDRAAEAEHAYRKAITLKPDYFEAYNNLAAMFIHSDREDEALRLLGDVLQRNGKHVPTLVQVARTQLSKHNHAQAEQACRFALKEEPDSAEAYVVLGQVMHETDRYSESLEAFERALQLKPDMGEAHNLYGVCLKSVGRMDDARAAFLKCIELNPRIFGVYGNLADLDKFTVESPHLQAMEAVVAEAEDPMSARYTGLHFALGKAYDDIGEYKKAFHHFKSGATLRRAELNYKEEDAVQFFDDIRSTFSREFFAKRPYEGIDTDVPVFIVGMPRSGSTLVEQVLSAHPAAFGAGEIKELSRSLNGARSRFPALPRYPALATKMNAAQYDIVANSYLRAIRKMSPDALRITDKLLTNYFFVGLLHTMFPKAKFINTRRNPVDTCLSAYTKLFKDDMPHSYDLGELGRYYRKYEELMGHWEEVLPEGTLKTIVYEDVVQDLEKSAREILDFVGLPFDEACLRFHESDRPVKTASVVQVRRPVYGSSVERWRRYGEDLNPLIEALQYQVPANHDLEGQNA